MKDYNTWRRDEIRRKVYDALAEIMFDCEGTKEDMDEALEWFNIRFYEDEYDEE